jgi:hypothetical protein
MTKDEINGLCQAVKRSHWDPIIGVKMFSRHNPSFSPSPEAYGIAIGVGRTPFPNLKGLPEGPFPVDKARPYWDARLWLSEEQKQWEEEMKLCQN